MKTIYKYLRLSITIIAVVSVFCLISCIKAVQKSSLDVPLMNGKKVLIVYGGWQGHSPKAFVDKITPWLIEEGAIITTSDSLGVYANEELLMSQDLIIKTWTMDQISGPQINGLLKAVKNGVGYAGCHGGTGDSFRSTVEHQYMVGGQWVAHPGGQIDYSIQIINSDDKVTKGLSDFQIHSEQYYMLVDPNVKVLATTTFSGEYNSWIDGAVIPVVWKKYFNKGRLFYYSVGHNMEDFDIPESKTILQRGFRWASESKYQEKEEWINPVYVK